jgi:hypothetical protein
LTISHRYIYKHFFRDIYANESTDIWDGIHYGNILVDGQVTEAGFRILFKDFLHEKGALPVGEIGKMLQDSTGISTLSTSLKMKFGGLKKFLEKYPEDFVIGFHDILIIFFDFISTHRNKNLIFQ